MVSDELFFIVRAPCLSLFSKFLCLDITRECDATMAGR